MAVANAGNLSPVLSSAPSLPRSDATFGHVELSPKQSMSSSDRPKTSASEVSGNSMTKAVPEVSVNGTPLRTPRPAKSAPSTLGGDSDDSAWGSNFWVTLVDPQVRIDYNIWGDVD